MLQVWDFLSGKLKKDLQYQADEQFMMHETAVLALNFSRDSELLVSGSQDGKMKVCHCLSWQSSQNTQATALPWDPDRHRGLLRVQVLHSNRSLNAVTMLTGKDSLLRVPMSEPYLAHALLDCGQAWSSANAQDKRTRQNADVIRADYHRPHMCLRLR